MFYQALKRTRIKRRHVTRTVLWIGVALMGADLFAALHFLQVAEHVAHVTGAGGATLAGLADAFERVAINATE